MVACRPSEAAEPEAAAAAGDLRRSLSAAAAPESEAEGPEWAAAAAAAGAAPSDGRFRAGDTPPAPACGPGWGVREPARRGRRTAGMA